MSFPAFVIDCAFASNPFDTPQTYTTISDSSSYVRARSRTISVNWGRHSEEETPGTGTSTTELLNNDRSFEPEYAAGPYYPNVIPERRIRCRALLPYGAGYYGGGAYATYPVFVHFTDGWPQPYDLQPRVFTPVMATDGLEVLAQAELPTGTSFAQERSGVRIGHILDAAGWPAAERAIDTGQEDMLAAPVGSLDGSFALNLVQQAADTELGVAFIAADGTFTYHDRYHRLVAPYNVSQATFTDTPGIGLPYARLVTNYDRQQIKNDWRITPSGGTEQAYEDAASIVKYRRRTRRRSTLHTSDVQGARQAAFLTNRYKDPHLRVEELQITPGDNSDLWAQVLTRQLGDRITVVFHPPGGGAPISQQVTIEAVAHTFTTDVVSSSTSWRLSPADNTTYWILGTSHLAVDTRLVY